VLEPLLKEIESLNERNQGIRSGGWRKSPGRATRKSGAVKQVKGVRTQIALTYVLTLDAPHRFRRSRDAGCFLGLRPGRRDSGESQPQMHINKEETAI